MSTSVVTLPPNPLTAKLGGTSAPPSTALPPSVTPQANGLPPNPLKGLVAPGVTPVPTPTAPAPAPVHHDTLPPSGLEQLQHQTETASAAGNADYNARSGTKGGVVVGMKPEDLKQLLALARANPAAAEGWASLVNPVGSAVQGGVQAAHGVSELAHGKLAHGALDVGLGGLAAAAVLPGGKAAKALEEATLAARGAEAIGEAAQSGKSLLPKWLGGGLAPRTEAEAQAHLAPLLEQAKAQGFGGHVGSEGHPPIVERGVSTPETHGDLGRLVREAMHGTPGEASPLRKAYADLKREDNAPDRLTFEEFAQRHPELSDVAVEKKLSAAEVRDLQKPLMSQERGDRALAAEKAMKEAGGGTAGLHAALSELEGRFGRESFPHLQHLTPEQLDTLHHAVDDAPLQTYERITANRALSNAVKDGVAPTEGEQALLERVFGKVKGEDVPAEPPSRMERLAGITNIPRALRSSADLSAAFRQNIVTAVTHPGVFAKSFAKSARMLVDPAYHAAVMNEMHNDPYFPFLNKISNGKLFTEIGDTAQQGASVAKREEAFVGSNIAERLNARELLPKSLKGGKLEKYATGPGDVIRASDRAFTGALNYTRFTVGKQLVEKAALMGHDLSDPKVGESIADVLGTMTGRGKVPRWAESHLVTANAALFSPRLIASRLNMLSPVYYYKLDPFARGEALKAARNMVAAMGTFMVAAKMAGATVTFNPQSSNFGKIRFGNTRIDITGGFNQYIRLIAQEMTREEISSNGAHHHIGWGRHDVSDFSNVVGKFGRSKLAPIPSLALDESTGKDFIGRPVKQGHELFGNAPFIAQDIVDAQQVGASPGRMAAAAFLSAIGFGVQSYKDKPQGRPTPKGASDGLPAMPSLPALPDLPALPGGTGK